MDIEASRPSILPSIITILMYLLKNNIFFLFLPYSRGFLCIFIQPRIFLIFLGNDVIINFFPQGLVGGGGERNFIFISGVEGMLILFVDELIIIAIHRLFNIKINYNE